MFWVNLMIVYFPSKPKAMALPRLTLLLTISTTLAILSACTTLGSLDGPPSRLEHFRSAEQAMHYVLSRQAALDKIEDHHYQSRSAEGLLEEDEVVVTGLRASAPEPIVESEALDPQQSNNSITNNQEAMVDEGDIVKRVGDYMLILRRGKIFSVHIGETVKKVDEINVQHENSTHEAWYDEMLVDNQHVVIVGYSYEHEQTEYVFLTLDEQGVLTREQTYLVASYDYYSSTNYASRLVDGNLVFYLKDIPVEGEAYNEDEPNPLTTYSAKIDDTGQLGEAYPLFASHDIYSPVVANRYQDLSATTIAICPLGKKAFTCHAKSIMGGHAVSTYSSRNAYYVWMEGEYWNLPVETYSDQRLKELSGSSHFYRTNDETVSAIYRIPFNGDPVGAVKVKGNPIDQFSFKERSDTLHVVAQTQETTFMASIALNKFKQEVSRLAGFHYTKVSEEESGYGINRFVDDKLVYIEEVYGIDDTHSKIAILNTDNTHDLTEITLPAEVRQLHPMGKNALVIAHDNNAEAELNFSTLDLGVNKRIAHTLAVSYDELAESRSHGFFYRPDSYSDKNSGGMFAVPVDVEIQDEEGVTADMLYTKVLPDLSLQEAGVLQGSRQVLEEEDDCEVSCTDWYGSARPIFWGDRVFALIKYEIIEGHRVGNRIEEHQRMSFQ